MNTEQLYAFRAVYEQHSFSKAASALGKSQSAVTQLVQSLENELGTTLVVRHKRPVTPTEAGDLFYPHAKKIIAEYEAALALFQNQKGFTFSYRVNRTECMDSFFDACYQPDFPEIKELPLACYRSTDAWQQDILYLVRRSVVQNKTIAYRKAYDSPLYAAVSAKSPLALKPAIKMEDLRKKTVILPPKAERTPFARQVYELAAADPQIIVKESASGFAADLTYVRLKNEVVFCTEELRSAVKNISFVIVEDGPVIEYGFASLNPFTHAMLSFIKAFETWYHNNSR